MVTIDIISDVSCPWCIIGFRSLQLAIYELDKDEEVEITWRPFELHSEMGPEGQDRAEYIQQKYGLTSEQAQANRQNLIDRGLTVGYEFNFPDKGRVYNTFDAHRLLHWAQQFLLQTELKLALFDLYFKHEGDPSNQQQLLQCVEEVGLSVQGAEAVLTSDQYMEEVRADQALTERQGVTAVPAFIFNNQYLVSGGQPKEAFMDVLQELDKES